MRRWWLLVLLVTAAAAVPRAWPVAERALWFDEGSTVYSVEKGPEAIVQWEPLRAPAALVRGGVGRDADAPCRVRASSRSIEPEGPLNTGTCQRKADEEAGT
jgi:hypothetical protein